MIYNIIEGNFNGLFQTSFKGALTGIKTKICKKKYNIDVIDLKFTQYISNMISDIVYKS